MISRIQGFDLIFCDRTGAKLIVEIQKGTLDRAHTYKILDYYDAFKEQHPHEFVEVMVVANVIPAERKQRLASMGIAYREIPTAEFLAKLGTGAEATPAQAQPEASKFSVTGQNPPVQSEVRGERPQPAFALFKDQQARLSIALRDCDPTLWFPPLRGNFEPDVPGNWFICFVPGAWGRWRSRNYGVHFDFAYARARRETFGVRLAKLQSSTNLPAWHVNPAFIIPAHFITSCCVAMAACGNLFAAGDVRRYIGMIMNYDR